ncbi:MAG: aminomethyltransferase family protein [Halobacteriaceae archaeon]
MTLVRASHERLGATFETVGGRAFPAHYGRPDRTVRAVRNGVGVTEPAYGVVAVSGADRIEFLDNALSNAVPAADGRGCYALLLDPQGAVRADCYVYTAAERCLVLTPPSQAADLAEEWAGRTFVQDVDVAEATADFAVFGVHGPSATEKVASVLNGASAPDDRLAFVRGRMNDVGVTVVRTDAPAGEEGYEVVVAADTAADRNEAPAVAAGEERPVAESAPAAVFDALLNYGLNAVPVGRRTWDVLTLEAGTPLFETELAGTIPNVAGVRNAIDFEKGCFVGQEVVSRVENRGRPSRRLVGLRCDALPAAGDEVLGLAAPGDGAGGASDAASTRASVGTVTRAVDSPSVEAPIAFATVEHDATPAGVRVDGSPVGAEPVVLPFVEGSERSARVPAYPETPATAGTEE